ncbi:MAG TPA: GntR family transcriptional regulator [Kribbella sp.]
MTTSKGSIFTRRQRVHFQPSLTQIAADLRGAIDSGILTPGDPIPSEKALAKRYDVAASTAHRAVALLVAAGVVRASRGVRATVAVRALDDGGPLATVTNLKPSGSGTLGHPGS